MRGTTSSASIVTGPPGSHTSAQARAVSCSDRADPSEQAHDFQSTRATVLSSHRADGLRSGRSNDDLWSIAFREARYTLDPQIVIAHIAGKTVVQILRDLDTTDKATNDESMFRRGLAHLRSAKGPLTNSKLALDLANPLVSFEPTAATVFGILRGFTTVRKPPRPLCFFVSVSGALLKHHL